MGWKPVPWMAALLALLAAPVGMLYVQRPWFALAYFVAAALAGLSTWLFSWAFDLQSLTAPPAAAGWMVSIIGAVHAFHIAGGSPSPGERKWYSRWYGLAG